MMLRKRKIYILKVSKFYANMISLLFLKIIQTPYNVSFFDFEGEIDGNWNLQKHSTIWRPNDVELCSLLIKLSLNVGNDDYIILCNFDGLIISGLEAEEGDLRTSPRPFPVAGSKKLTGRNFSLADTCDLESHTAFHR